MTVYDLLKGLPGALWRRFGTLNVQGAGNIPASGPFLLIANHQSILDPLLIQSVIQRPIHTMTKSTQFQVPFLGWLMANHLNCFPVRRYEVDPQAVRMVLRRLREGEGVGIYVEGERSWDGRLQPPRRGAVRLLMATEVPVIPAVITGSYEAWPRWARRPARADIQIRFGRALALPKPAARREEREAVLAEATRCVVAALDPGGRRG